MFPEHSYLISIEARDGLLRLFSHPTKVTQSRNRKQAFHDGISIITQDPTIEHEELRQSQVGISHNLNLLAAYYEPLELIDARDDDQIETCELQLTVTPPQILTHAQAKLLRHEKDSPFYGYVSGALWSNVPLVETIDNPFYNKENPELTPDEDKTIDVHKRHPFRYHLSPYSRTFYEFLAKHYRMRPPTLRKVSTTSRVAAAIEAIGCGWLKPPEDFQSVMQEYVNQHMIRPNRSQSSRNTNGKRQGKKYGNHTGTPYVYQELKPFTQESIEALRQQMIANGEIQDD